MSFVKLPTEIIFDKNLTAGEVRLLAALINFTLDDTNKTFIGNYKLAEYLGTSRAAVLRSLKELSKKQYLSITPRKNSSKSNEILLTLERGINFALAGAQKKPLEGNHFDTPQGNHFDTPQGNHFDTVGNHFDTPHIDLKFKNQDLLFKAGKEQGNHFDTPEGGKGGVVNDSVLESVQMTAKVGNHIAPADDATGRSMPNQESARKVQVETQAANDDKSLVEGIKANFKDIAADLEVFKVGNQYGLRKKSKYSLIEAVRASEVVEYLASLGIVAQVVDYNQHYPNEEVI